MKTTVVQWFQWFGEAMTHALGSFNDRHLLRRRSAPSPTGTRPTSVPATTEHQALEQISAAEATRFRHGVSIDAGSGR